MSGIRVLLVDDDEVVRMSLHCVLQHCGFIVTTAANVSEALKLISSEALFNVLLTDLHMPGAGDGLTVVSAMRHANPLAVTILMSAFPEMNVAAQAILLQTDEILVKPLDIARIGVAIQRMVSSGAVRAPQGREIEDAAVVLERTLQSTLQNCFERIQADEKLAAIRLGCDAQCGSLALVLRDIVANLRTMTPRDGQKPLPTAAIQYGAERYRQGYAAAMLVEEFRLLQASIYHTLQSNLASINFNLLLAAVINLADEIDVQLGHAVASYTAEALRPRALPLENDPHRSNPYLSA